MKKLYFLAVLFVLSVPALATVHTVSNDPMRPAQFDNLQTAINAAAAGDTLYILGTPYVYPNVSAHKRIVLMGSGHVPMLEGGYPTRINYLDIAAASKGSLYTGLWLNGMEIRSSTDSVIIENCRFSGWIDMRSVWNNPASNGVKNLEIRNNVFVAGGIHFEGASSLYKINITNNIFSAGAQIIRAQSASNTYLTIANNVFYGADPNAPVNNFALDEVRYATIRDNIFYARKPARNCNPSTAVNNLVFTTGYSSLGGSLTESNTISGQNPMFVNYPTSDDGTFNDGDEVYDFTLQAGSPGINAGQYGDTIGVDESLNLKGTPSIPQITTFTISNDKVNVGDNISFSVEAKSAGIE